MMNALGHWHERARSVFHTDKGVGSSTHTRTSSLRKELNRRFAWMPWPREEGACVREREREREREKEREINEIAMVFVSPVVHV